MTDTADGMPPDREAWDTAGMVRRGLAALQRRAAAGDSAAFEELLTIERETVPEQVRLAGQALHDAGYSWAQIGQMAGTTRAAAHYRYGR